MVKLKIPLDYRSQIYGRDGHPVAFRLIATDATAFAPNLLLLLPFALTAPPLTSPRRCYVGLTTRSIVVLAIRDRIAAMVKLSFHYCSYVQLL